MLNREPESDPTIPFALEPVEEVIAKKLFCGGWALTARDLFDWKAVSGHPRYRQMREVAKGVLIPDRRALLAASIEKLSVLPEAKKQWEGLRATATVLLSAAVACARAGIESMEVAPGG